MEKTENRGKAVAEFQRQRRAAGIEQVRAYYQENPFTTVKGAARDLGMHYATIARYVREIRKQDRVK